MCLPYLQYDICKQALAHGVFSFHEQGLFSWSLWWRSSSVRTYVDRRTSWNVIGAAVFWNYFPELHRLFGIPETLRLQWLMR